MYKGLCEIFCFTILDLPLLRRPILRYSVWEKACYQPKWGEAKSLKRNLVLSCFLQFHQIDKDSISVSLIVKKKGCQVDKMKWDFYQDWLDEDGSCYSLARVNPVRNCQNCFRKCFLLRIFLSRDLVVLSLAQEWVDINRVQLLFQPNSPCCNIDKFWIQVRVRQKA